MGRRGPKPQPTVVLKMRGSRNLSRRNGELSPEVGTPNCPEWLSDVGKEKWRELIEQTLTTKGLVTIADGDAIAFYCLQFCSFLDALTVVRSEGSICYSEKGGAYPHPAILQQNRAIELMLKIGDAFGMTPSARTSIKLSPQQATESTKKKFFA